MGGICIEMEPETSDSGWHDRRAVPCRLASQPVRKAAGGSFVGRSFVGKSD